MAEAYRAYNPPRSADWNFGGPKWKLSRSKIDLFTDCPLCFYLDNRLGVARPRGPSFTLNIAVDALLKKEFDLHRTRQSIHPLLEKYGVDAVPFAHAEMDKWRENFVGIQYRHPGTGFLITGAIDDIWVNKKGELIIVDYKATSKDGDIHSLSDSGWDEQYKRQMEIYQWLFRQKGFKVSSTGYFVYVNGKKDRAAFDGKLEFDVTLIPHTGKDDWIEGVLKEIQQCLENEELPQPSQDCDHCRYRKFAQKVQIDFLKKTSKTVSVEKKPVAKKTTRKKSDENNTSSLF
jgi:CRISPR/Cas system-associated exonuclease Cas4 (RecB family)